MQALGHFYRTSAQAGTDYVFTYGPLGYFATEVYDGQLYWQRYLWELAGQARRGHRHHRGARPSAGRGLTLLGAVLVIVFVPYHFDTIYQVTLLAAGVLLIDGACRGRPGSAVVVPLLALLAMTKFTYFLLALWAVVAGGVGRPAQGLPRLAVAGAALPGLRSWPSGCSADRIRCTCGPTAATPGKSRRATARRWPPPGEAFDVGLAAVTMSLAVLLAAAGRLAASPQRLPRHGRPLPGSGAVPRLEERPDPPRRPSVHLLRHGDVRGPAAAAPAGAGHVRAYRDIRRLPPGLFRRRNAAHR